MKLIIAGTRTFDDYKLLCKYLDRLIAVSDIEIISGTANGADKLGERYAKEHNIKLIKIPAEWDTYGKKAGFIRNYDMGLMADMAIVFWNGKSRGTKHMIDIMKELGKQCYVVKYYEKQEI